MNDEFIYPDSIPFHRFLLNEKFEISQAEKEYLEKYKNCIPKQKKGPFGFQRNISY